MKINENEIRRYLGYGRNPADEPVSVLITQCIRELEQAASPRFLYRIFPLTLRENNLIDMGFIQVTSQNLSKNLRDCSQIAVMAATLGVEPDRLINRYSRTDIAKGVVMQAAAAAMIEAWCRECQEEIRKEAGKMGLFLRPRFSPGYGDFPLESQKAIIQTLQAPKKIGLTVTDSLLMAPMKSVTAVIGLSKKNSACQEEGCEVCEKKNCIYRR